MHNADNNNNNDDPNAQQVVAGIVFEDFEMGSNGEVPDLKYKIRMNSRDVEDQTSFLFPQIALPGPGNPDSKL